MGPQDSCLLMCPRVPQLHRPVAAARACQKLPTANNHHTYGIHRASVALQGSGLLTRPGVPNPHGSFASACQKLPATDGHRTYRLNSDLVAFQDGSLLTWRRVPQSYTAAVVSDGEQF